MIDLVLLFLGKADTAMIIGVIKYGIEKPIQVFYKPRKKN